MDNTNSCNQSEHGGKNPGTFLEKTNEYNSIKHVVGIVSGKGGVGKSMVSAMLAVLSQRKGYKVGILDGDITGPSIPKMFGVKKAGGIPMLGRIPIDPKLTQLSDKGEFEQMDRDDLAFAVDYMEEKLN